MALVRIVTDLPEPESHRGESESRVGDVFTRQAADARVMIAHGYGVRVGVWNGHLEVSDGIGRHRRTRRVPKADRELQRLIITGTEGYATLAALRWCRDHGVSVTTLDRDGDLVAASVPHPGTAVSLLRQQALAGIGGPMAGKGIEVSAYLLDLKLRGQAANLVKLLGQHRQAGRIEHHADMLTDASTYEELNELERWSANAYFHEWVANGVAIPWAETELDRIPSNWLRYGRRKTGAVNTSKRHTTDPINAMLNFGYSIGYAEARIACIANRLNPALGFIHSDHDARDSLALDILEAIRPEIDSYILGLLGYGSEPRAFTRKDFTEPKGYPHGTVRLVAPLTHEIAEQSVVWQGRLNEITRTAAGILGAPAGKQGKRLHNLAMQKTEFVNRPVDVDKILPVEALELVRAILPPERPHPKGGYAPISTRTILAAMIYLEHHRKPWAQVPTGFAVSRSLMSHRRQDWKRLGIWDEVWSFVLDQSARNLD